MYLTIGLGIVGVLVAFIYLAYQGRYNNQSTSLSDFFACFFVAGAVGAITGAIISLPFDGFLPRHWVKTSEAKLVSVRDRDGFQGSFFLGSGNIDGFPYYFYYKELNDGGLQPSRVRANNQVIIYEEDRKDGKFEYYEYVLKNQSLNWLIYNKSKGFAYYFRIPEGSIKRSFSL